MSTAIGDLVATLGMNVAPFQQAMTGAKQSLGAFTSGVRTQLGQVRGAISGALSGIGLGTIGGMLAGGGIVTGLYGMIASAGEAARETKKLGVILGSTAGAADLSKDDLVAYAQELQEVTNFSKEASIQAMTMMMPFKERIPGDTFKEVLRHAQDITAILGGDLSGNARKLAMVLADPLKGMRMLRSFGITMSEDDKRRIKTLLEQNKLTEAQSILLKKVASVYGGDAEKMASPMTQLKNRLHEIGVQIGSFLLPYVRAFATSLMSSVEMVIGWATTLKDRFGGLLSPVGQLWAQFTANPMVSAILTALPLVASLGVVIGALIPVTSAVFGFFATAIGLILGPIGIAIGAIVAIGAALVYCMGEGDTFAEKFQSILQDIAKWVDTLAFVWRNFGNLAKLAVVDLALSILETFPSTEKPIQSAAAAFVGAWAGAKAFFATIVDNIVGGLKEIWNVAKAVGAGIQAAWSELAAGNFSKIGSAFGDAFLKEFASQADVKAPNAFAEMKKAADEASGQFLESVQQKGGMHTWLADQKKELEKGIADNEARWTMERSKQATQAAAGPSAHSPTGPWKQPNVAPPPKESKDKTEIGKALDFFSDEAWKKMVNSFYGISDEKEKAALDTAANTARAADALEEIANRDEPPDFIGA